MSHPHLERTRAALILKKYDVARQQAILALAAEPDNPMAHQLLGESLMRLGDFAGGIEQAAEVLRLAPNWGWGHWLLGCCWFLDDKTFPGIFGKAVRLAKAAEAAQHALARDPCEPAFYALAAGTAINQGHIEAALVLIDRGLCIAPQFAALHQLRGNAYCALRDPRHAIQCFATSLELGPEDSECHRDLANILFENGQYRAAQEHIQEAVRLDPGNAVARELLLRVSQTQHWLMRGANWLNRPLHLVRVFFPVWVVATVCLGLPIVVWMETSDVPLWLCNVLVVVWIAIVALPLESLAVPAVLSSLWFLFGGRGRADLSWQNRGSGQFQRWLRWRLCLSSRSLSGSKRG